MPSTERMQSEKEWDIDVMLTDVSNIQYLKEPTCVILNISFHRGVGAKVVECTPPAWGRQLIRGGDHGAQAGNWN